MLQKPPFVLGGCEIRPADLMICRGDHEVRIQPRAMRVLMYLAAHALETVPRADLLDHGWANASYVSDEALTKVISLLRKAFRDCGCKEEIVRTVPRIGYRLVVAPQALEARESVVEAVPPSRMSQPKTRMLRRRWRAAFVGVFLAASTFGLGYYYATQNTSMVHTVRHTVRLDSADVLSAWPLGTKVDTIHVSDDGKKMIRVRSRQKLAEL